MFGQLIPRNQIERSPTIYDVVPPRFRLKVEDLLLPLKSATKSIRRCRLGLRLRFAFRLDLSYLLQVTLGSPWAPTSRLQQVKVPNKEVLGLALLSGTQLVPKL